MAKVRMKEIEVALDAGPVEIAVTIGNAHFGRYRLTLWDKSGRNGKVVGEGINTDNKPDRYYIDPRECDGTILGWEINIAAYGQGANQSYSATVSVQQSGSDCGGSPFEHRGRLVGGVKAILEYARMSVS